MKHPYSSLLPRWVPRPLALLLATASAAYAQTPAATFAPVAIYSMGPNSTPLCLAVADVNGDGKPDLLTLNASVTAVSNTVVAVLLGTGNGTFQTATTFSTGTNTPTRIAVADVNGDSKPDLLTVNVSSSSASVLLGNGDGTFQAAANFGTGPESNPYNIAVADVNSDGKPDLLTVNTSSDMVAVLLGTGTGTFQAAATFSTGPNSFPYSITVADVNGDSKPDLLTANFSNDSAGVLLGNGDGTFQTATAFGIGSNSKPYEIAVADVNGDGKPDLLTANAGSDSAGVLLGNGDGTFQAAATFGTGTNSSPRSLAVADVNGDGKPDLLTANSVAKSASVLLGNGNGTFQAVVTYNAGGGGRSLAVADVNGDGKPDLLTANFSNSVGVLLNTTVYVPTLTTPANGSTSNGQPILAGTAPSGSTVTLTLTNTTTGGSYQFITTAPNGTFSTQASGLASGSYQAAVMAQLNGQHYAGTGTSFQVDAMAPTATITTTVASPIALSPIPFTVTFSKPVVGFSASGISVTNGTLTSVLTAAGNTYSFSVTPTAGGLVTVSVLANAAQDALGNDNLAAGPLSVLYIAPVTLTTWNGALSTDWFTAGNWTAGVPTASVDALVPTGPVFSPQIAAGAASVKNLTLTSGASLSQRGGTLSLAGDLTNNGTFTATGGTVILGASTVSTSAATIYGSSASRFWSLTVQANGLLLNTSASTSVRQVLTLTGSLTTQGNPLTLESSSTNTALVVNSGGRVIGAATVQRAIDPSVNPGLGYRHYSAPVSNSTVSDLATGTFAPVVNQAYNAAAAPTSVTPFPTVFRYDDRRLSLPNSLTSFDKGYYSPTLLSDPLIVGRGYTVHITASEVVDFQGTLNYGTLPLELLSTRPTYPDGGWQLLGNPYPAPLDYSRVAAADRVGLEAAIYVYSSTSQYGGSYRSYVNGIGNPVLPVGQAFFARVAIGQVSATMTFRDSQRLSVPNSTTFQRTAADPRPQVQLELRASTGLTDTFIAYAEAGIAAAFDSQYDAMKMPNTTGLNLAGVAVSGERLAIDGRAAFGAATVIPLVVSVPAAGTYTLAAADLANLPAGLIAYLADSQTGQVVPLAAGTSYPFRVTASQAASAMAARFTLQFSASPAVAPTASLNAEVVRMYPNPAHAQVAIELPLNLSHQPITVTLLDAMGRNVRQQVLPANLVTHTLLLTDLTTGVYSLRLTTGLGTLVKKLVIQ
jgi:hypothetical protein